jgi:hypothetical protein
MTPVGIERDSGGRREGGQVVEFRYTIRFDAGKGWWSKGSEST